MDRSMKGREYEVKCKNFGLRFQGMELKSSSSASPTVILGMPYASLGINFSKGKIDTQDCSENQLRYFM